VRKTTKQNNNTKSFAAMSVDENKHLYVSETALLELMDLCEPLEAEEIDDLIEKT